MTIKVTDLNSLAVGQETFYHKYFQRHRPDLLKNLQRRTAVDGKSGKKRKKARAVDDASVAALQGKLETMEQQTKEMLSAMQQMREENFASASAIRELHNSCSAMDVKIQAMEKRIEWLECRTPGSLPSQQQQQFRQPSHGFASAREAFKPRQLLDSALARQAMDDASGFSAKTGTENESPSLFQNITAVAPMAVAPNSATLAPHPRMKRFPGASNNVNAANKRVDPKDIFSFENPTIQGPISSRETSLDINFLSSLGREHSL